MRDYGIDGAWLQHFLVDLPGGPQPSRYPSRLPGARPRPRRGTGDGPGLGALLRRRRHAAGPRSSTSSPPIGRRWWTSASSKTPATCIKSGKPAVQIWGFYFRNEHNRMTAELANRLIDFFQPRPLFRLPGRGRRLELAAQSRPGLAEVLPPVRRLLPLEHRQLRPRQIRA